MPMGLGYVAAADRLGLIYLADAGPSSGDASELASSEASSEASSGRVPGTQDLIRDN